MSQFEEAAVRWLTADRDRVEGDEVERMWRSVMNAAFATFEQESDTPAT